MIPTAACHLACISPVVNDTNSSLRMQVSGVSLAPGAPVSSVALDSAPGRPLAVPLVAGTPRYLLFRNVYNEDLRPPKVVPNCSILFQVRCIQELVSSAQAVCNGVAAPTYWTKDLSSVPQPLVLRITRYM